MSAPAPRLSDSYLADREQLARFVDAVFRYADPGTFASLRIFPQSDPGARASHTEGVAIGADGLDKLIARAVAVATRAGSLSEPALFSPPLATFFGPKRATVDEVACGLVITVELDARPSEGRTLLEGLLGPATLVVASGGEWVDPNTGELHPKLHLHWRLNEATTTPEEHARLRYARQLAAELVGADRSAVPIPHPFRWPGSWHLKNPDRPRLAEIVAGDPEHEVGLNESIDLLEWAVEERGRAPGGGARSSSSRPQADPKLIAEALSYIPNLDVDWDEWNNRIGLATFAATGGSAAGLEAFETWSAKSTKHNSAECAARWEHFQRSPPSRIGAGTIFYLAMEHQWQPPWRKVREEAPSAEEQQQAEQEQPAKPAAAQGDSENKRGKIITEDSLAQEFVDRHSTGIRYCHTNSRWYRWDGSHWQADETKHVTHSVRLHLRDKADAMEKAEMELIVKLGRRATVSAVEGLAQADPRVTITVDAFDKDPWLLGTPGGTVDLRTGELRRARPGELVTMQTAVAPAAAPDCPTFLAFLEDTFRGDYGRIRFIQQFFGYSLTGSTQEQQLAFAFGPGGNGKGTLMNTLYRIMGDYAHVAEMDMLMSTNKDRHPTELAALKGKRLVVASEVDDNREWAERKLNSLTGSDPITARFMAKDFFTFLPTHKLFVIGNYKPRLRNVNDAARRRYNMIPFTNKPAVVNTTLERELEAEWPGILRWMIDGCLDWQKNGLVRPEAVVTATREYFQDQDIFGQWLEECCEVGSGCADTIDGLYESWGNYARKSGVGPGSKTALGDKLKQHDENIERCHHTPGAHGNRGYKGVQRKVDTNWHDYTDGS